MYQNVRLIYPTIDLFLYDLAEGLGESAQQLNQNRQDFWHKVYGKSLTTQQLEKLAIAETSPEDHLELLSGKPTQPLPHSRNGYYYPVKLGDTYVLQVDCSRKTALDSPTHPETIDSLQQIQQDILDSLHSRQGTIGQSWLIWAQWQFVDERLPSPANHEFLQSLAKACYQQLQGASAQLELKPQGEFLGAHWFEVWQPPGDRGSIEQNHHVVIALFQPYQKIADIQQHMRELFPKLLQLFQYRNKIIWAYHQTRQLKTELKKAAPRIQDIANELPDQVNTASVNLNTLQQRLADTFKLLAGYTSYLIELEEQHQTIKVNLSNYRTTLKRIKTLDSNMSPSWLKEFSTFAAQKYVPQVESDLLSLSPSLRLLENTIKTIEGIIAIEQAKRDRRLNETIAFTGTGLAVSGVAATVLMPLSPTSKSDPTSKSEELPWSVMLFSSVVVFLISLSIGLCFAYIVRGFLRSRA